MLTIEAPAKLNLTLEVLAKRDDGFHEIRSVIQTINLCDRLHFRRSHDIGFEFDTTEWMPQESLVSKAVRLVQEATGCNQGVTIEVSKRIPLRSGLGGDSSDAAATLRGLNRLWGLELSAKDLLELALQLGSDVPFFVYGGTALVGGRGEMITPLPPLPPISAVLMMPPVPRAPGKTGQLYASLRPGHYTDGGRTDTVVLGLTGGGELTPCGLFNVFDAAAADNYPGIDAYRRQLLSTGAGEVHLAGSGPALFALMKDKIKAEKVYSGLRRQGLECYLAETFNAVIQW